MSAQDTGGYRCNMCGMIFNSLGDLDAHTREKHNIKSTTTTWQKMSNPRPGAATEEMVQIAKDEDIDLNLIVQSCKWLYHYSKK